MASDLRGPRPAARGGARPARTWVAALLWLVAVCLPGSCSTGDHQRATGAGASTGSGPPDVTLGPADVQVLEDATATLALSDVERAPWASQFRALDRPVLNAGHTSSAYWLRFEVGPTGVPLLLEVDNPTLTDVRVHRLGRSGRLTSTHTGQALPLSSREVDHPSFLFTIAPEQATTVHVRVASRAPIRVPLRLWHIEAFHAADRVSALLNGLFYGAMVLAAVFQLMLSFAVRDRTHPIFVGAIAMTCVTLLGFDGLGTYHLWPRLAPWATDITTFAAVATVVGLLAFTSQFLALRERTRAAHRILVAAGVLMIACGLLVPRTAIYMTVAGAALVATLIAGVHAWMAGYPPARRFVAAWALLSIGFVWGQLVLVGYPSPGGLSADQLYRMAALPAVAMVSVSLVDRLWLMRRAAETAEAALRRQEQALVEVARGVVGTTGDEVFTALVRHLARALGADRALVGELTSAGDRVRTVAVWSDGEAADNVEYDLPGSPCEHVLREGVSVFTDAVQARFPRDAGLAALRIRGYVGAPLHDSAGRPIGVLVCLYRRPVAEPAAAERTLQLFAGRAASELERRRAERALAEREALLGALLESSPALIYVKDPEGRYLLVNRQYEQRMGLSRERILGHTDAEFMAPPVAGMLRANDLEALASDAPKQFEEGDAGSMFLSTKAALRDAAGVPWAMIGVSTDITEFQRLQAQVRAAQRMEAFGQLAGGVAHDFNNLLTAILGYLDLCERQVPPSTPVASDLAEARQATLRAARITDQLLAFARRQPAAPQVVDLTQVVRDVERLLRQAAGAGVTLEYDLSAGPVGVRVDPAQFEQVLLNLVLNARDAMPGGGTVRIDTGIIEVRAGHQPPGTDLRPGRYARLRVTDTGTGIAAADLPRIFEPFFTTKVTGRGTGLGLSMCHGIVRQAGGAIAVDSVAGQGAVFTVYVPEAKAQPDARVTAATPGAAGGSETILVAEDEPSIRRFTARVLTGRGYRVLMAGDGASALSMAAAHDAPIDLLLTDVSMPGMNGRELADRLRVARPGIAVLYMSGYGEQALADDGIVADGSPYLGKPFAQEQLAAKVREVLDGRGPIAATGQ